MRSIEWTGVWVWCLEQMTFCDHPAAFRLIPSASGNACRNTSLWQPRLPWQRVVISVQRLLDQSMQVGGRNELEQQGLTRYVRFSGTLKTTSMPLAVCLAGSRGHRCQPAKAHALVAALNPTSGYSAPPSTARIANSETGENSWQTNGRAGGGVWLL